MKAQNGQERFDEMSLNSVVLIGRLTKDPELKYTPQGTPVASLSIAVDRFTKGSDGNYETDFFNCTAWRKTAEFAGQYLKKGRLVSVQGRIQNRSWVDATSGQKRTVTEIQVDNINGLDKPKEGDVPTALPQNTSAPPASAPAPAPVAAAPEVDDTDTSDPFADE